MSEARGAAFWSRLVREVEAGGRTLDVARRNGVSQSGLVYWRRKLRKTSESGALLPVRVVDDRIRRVELAIGPHRISFDEGSEPSYIVALVHALSR